MYQSRGWTEWTQGFQFGASLLQFDATGDREFLELGRSRTLERMAPHLTHVGVHDHGFNNVSTYGNLWRLAREGTVRGRRVGAALLRARAEGERRRAGGRWTPIPDGGFIYSFNGAHSLFVDTIRTLRALALSHVLGHRLFEEQDVAGQSARSPDAARDGDSGLQCLLRQRPRRATTCAGARRTKACSTPANGTYRGPSSQQGYSPFSTWTRGLAWAMLGFAEQLEFLATIDPAELEQFTNDAKMGSDPILRRGGGDV